MTPYGAACDMERDYGMPVIVVHPGRHSGAPTIGHSRLPAHNIANTYWHYGADEVKNMWDYLTDADILVCCWFIAHYGTRTERRRFKDWRDEADMMLWSRDTFTDCAWPPTNDTQ
jgi:uncharacterized protein (DUF433 family)